eukprot:10477808-Ditylum_brightwellii.AAC.1
MKLYVTYYPMSPDLILGIQQQQQQQQQDIFLRAVNVHVIKNKEEKGECNGGVYGACLRSTLTILKCSSEKVNVIADNNNNTIHARNNGGGCDRHDDDDTTVSINNTTTARNGKQRNDTVVARSNNTPSLSFQENNDDCDSRTISSIALPTIKQQPYCFRNVKDTYQTYEWKNTVYRNWYKPYMSTILSSSSSSSFPANVHLTGKETKQQQHYEDAFFEITIQLLLSHHAKQIKRLDWTEAGDGSGDDVNNADARQHDNDSTTINNTEVEESSSSTSSLCSKLTMSQLSNATTTTTTATKKMTKRSNRDPYVEFFDHAYNDNDEFSDQNGNGCCCCLNKDDDDDNNLISHPLNSSSWRNAFSWPN